MGDVTREHGSHRCLSDFLDSRREAILESWETRVRSLPAARPLSSRALRDHVPVLLGQIAQIVRGMHTGEPAGLEDVPDLHALHRLDAGYDLHEAALDLAALRDTVLELWQKENGELLAASDVRAFNTAVDEILVRSVDRFARSRERTLRALDRVSSLALEARDLDRFLPELLRAVIESTEAVDTAAILLVSEEEPVLHVRAAIGLPEEQARALSLRVGEGFAGRIAAEGRPLFLRDASTDPLVKGADLREAGVHALCGVPLRHGEKVIGVAYMGSKTAFELSTEDRQVFETMAQRATGLIVQTQLAEELRRSQNLLQAIIDNSPAAIFVKDTEGRYLLSNRTVERLLHGERGEVRGMTDAQLLGEEAAAPLRANDLKAFESGQPIQLEERLLTEEGPRTFLSVKFALPPEAMPAAVCGIATDVTEERRAQEAIAHQLIETDKARLEAERNRDQLEAVIEAMDDGVVVADMEGSFLLINESEARMNGFASAREMGRSLDEVCRLIEITRPDGALLPLEDWPINRVLRGESLDRIELRGRRRDTGQSWFFSFSGEPIRDRTGRQILAVLVTRDITAQKASEQRLAELLEQTTAARAEAERALAELDTVFSSTPIALAFLDRELRFSRVNTSLSQIDGLPLHEHLGKTVREVMEGELGERLEQMASTVFAGGSPLWNQELAAPLPSLPGQHRRWTANVYPVLSNRDGVIGVGFTLLDVTEQAQLVEALQTAVKERERAVAVLEHGDAVFVLDKEFRFLLVNQNQERLSRTRREETLGRVFWEVFPAAATPESKYWTEYHRAMRERVELGFEEYYAPLDIWTDVRVYPTSDGGIAVFFLDATERKRAQQFQERLMGIVGHDLRNPLGAISLSSQSLLRRGDELPPFALAAAKRISNSAERMANMINQLLDFTRARVAGGIPVLHQWVDLCSVATRVVEELEIGFPGRLRLSCGTPVSGQFDPDRLAQVLSNLVFNALKHGSKDRPVEVDIKREGDEAVLTVRNEGPAIRESLLPTLFDPFKRTTVHADSGLGLGLYIANHIVVRHGGWIDVKSNPEEGTVFSVRLPIVSEADAAPRRG